MLAAYNLVGVVSNNGNQNNDNNINRNNINNNNNQNVNEATTDTMTMSMGMVIAPPLPPGRMLNVSFVDPTSRQKRGSFHVRCFEISFFPNWLWIILSADLFWIDDLWHEFITKPFLDENGLS